VFGSAFEREIAEDRVSIFGQLGAHRMRKDGSYEVIDEYSLDTSFEFTRYLLTAFLKEIEHHGSPDHKNRAISLHSRLEAVKLENPAQPSNVTAEEFYSIAREIREHFDPEFRIINNGVTVETHSSHPLWSSEHAFTWLQNVINHSPHHLISCLHPWQKRIATGVAKKDDYFFNYLLICKTNKGLSIKKVIEEKLKKFPNALIITIGDTMVDFPMHRHAHVAFHVGLEKVWKSDPLAHCIMVRNHKGEDSQHIEGTLKVLSLLQEGIGKSFYDWKHVLQEDASGKWNYYSIRELDLLHK
jgi:hypothetical protein